MVSPYGTITAAGSAKGHRLVQFAVTIAANATLPELRIALERSARDEHDVNQALDELDRAVGRS